MKTPKSMVIFTIRMRILRIFKIQAQLSDIAFGAVRVNGGIAPVSADHDGGANVAIPQCTRRQLGYDIVGIANAKKRLPPQGDLLRRATVKYPGATKAVANQCIPQIEAVIPCILVAKQCQRRTVAVSHRANAANLGIQDQGRYRWQE